jgi:hypothetical protein
MNRPVRKSYARSPKSGSRKKAVLVRILAAIVFGSVVTLGGVSAAEADETVDEICASRVANLISGEQGVGAGLNLESSYNFTCSETGTIVTGYDADGSLIATLEETYDADEDVSAGRSALFTCTAASSPTRDITSRFTSEINFCIIYGQNNSPVNGSWTENQTIRWQIGLQRTWHPVDFRVTPSGSFDYPTSWDGVLTMQHQNGIFPPNDVESNEIGKSAYGQFTALGGAGGTPLSETGTYAIRIHDMAVFNSRYNFSSDVAFSVTSQRFVCANDQQCEWPNMEEAPV